MLYSITKGTGSKIIIFVHGNSQSLHTWDAVTDSGLLSQFQLIAVDLPGHGLSPRSTNPSHDYTLAGMGEQLRAFLAMQQAHEFILVGVSLGCNVIGEAGPFPANCKGIFLLGPQIIGGAVQVRDIVKPNARINAMFMPNPPDALIECFLDDLAKDMDPTIRQQCKQSFLDTDPVFRQYFTEALGKQKWCNEIQSLQAAGVPLAIVYGAEESIVFIGYLNKTGIIKWRNETLLVPNAGHLAQLDQPEAVANLINDFALDCFKG